ncbi:CapA family protein [Stigmatella sp. ncwal1]|uniref:CapA family protein n=1 Tax=Stigmatella ashevillensis TaxID=2995309 RepID=A0ABT5DEH3_9BACT|nr:CapA family protein [Stigmatella ashevillena]MDC0711906.1 CapA family protein [Stigmatella ashevillena]
MSSSVLLLLVLSVAPASPPPPASSPVSSASEEAVRDASRRGAAVMHRLAVELAAEARASLIQEYATSADAHFSRGVEALKAKDAVTAISELSQCVALRPESVPCRWELGWAYSLENRWNEALAEWTEVGKLKPDQPELEEVLAQARAQVALQERLSKPPEPSQRPPPPPDARLRLRAVGDVMLGTTVPEEYLPPEGPASVISAVKGLLEDADLTFVNLEGPLCDGGKTNKCRSDRNCYAFRSPTEYGQALKEAGVDVASTANNHAGDFGEECRRQTEATLDALGIAWSGPPGTVATVERNGLRIGLVAFHSSPTGNHLNNLPTATALVESVAAGHDLVLVSFHGGAEGGKALHVPHGKEKFMGEDRGDLRTFTRAMVDAGAHLVLGHGPHVARAMEFYKGRLIAYSMGNFATYGRFNLQGPQGLGMVLEVELDREGRFLSGKILPTRQVGEGLAVPDPKGAVLKLVRKLSAEDFPDSGARVDEDGTVAPRGKVRASASGAAP